MIGAKATTLTLGTYLAYGFLGLLATAGVFALCCAVGPDVLHGHVLNFGYPQWDVLQLRLMRVSAALLVGWALAASGVALQALLRNALAEPYVLGISGGSSVGVMLWLLAVPASTGPLRTWLLAGQMLPAVAGAVLTCLIVFALARLRGGAELDPLATLLVGVVISAVNGAVLMLLGSLRNQDLGKIARYMMGTISEETSTWQMMTAGGAVLAGWLPLMLGARALNISTLSDVEVAALGVKVSRLRTMAFLCAALMTAGSIALAGPIGFVGLICPHVCRSIFGPDHRQLTITAPFCGAIFLMIADTFVRSTTTLFNGDLPVGVITALAGGPFFLVLLRRRAGGGDYAA